MKIKVSIAILTKLLGKHGRFWFAVAVVSSGFLAATDYGIAIFIDILLKNLGLAPEEAHVADWLGSWNPTAGKLIVLLTMVGLLRGIAQFGVYQGNDLVHEVVKSQACCDKTKFCKLLHPSSRYNREAPIPHFFYFSLRRAQLFTLLTL